jgi:four helix bundle protein
VATKAEGEKNRKRLRSQHRKNIDMEVKRTRAMTWQEERKEAMRRRTKLFAGEVVRFFIALDKRREELRVLGKQLLRAGTSVAANYREASRARSDAEFVAKIELCASEVDETQLWLELLRDDCVMIAG